MPNSKKPWADLKAIGREDSFIGSYVSKTELEPKRGSLLNSKLLEMVIKTINKRPSAAGEFQRGLAKTATQTWNSHINERKKMTKKQKVVEEIASNLGLARGFKTEFQDEAERLVSILFKEIGKKKSDTEISTDESSSTTVEEESDKSIKSIQDIPEPIVTTKLPPGTKKIIHTEKAPMIAPKVPTHLIVHLPPHKTSQLHTKRLSDARPDAPATNLGLSFINVTELKTRQDRNTLATPKESKAPTRTYMEIISTKDEDKPTSPQSSSRNSIPKSLKKMIPKKIPKEERVKENAERKATETKPAFTIKPKIEEVKSETKEIKRTWLLTKEILRPEDKSTELAPTISIKRFGKKTGRSIGNDWMQNWGEVAKLSQEEREILKDRYNMRRLAREKRATKHRRSIKRDSISLMLSPDRERSSGKYSRESGRSSGRSSKGSARGSQKQHRGKGSRISYRRSSRSGRKQSKKKKRETVEYAFDEKTKEYIIREIKDMLDMLTAPKRNSEQEEVRQRRRHRKSIFVLWKNYFDIRNSENIFAAPTIKAQKKNHRYSMLESVDEELVKAGIFERLVKFVGVKNARPSYEQTLWQYLNETANRISEDKDELNDKILENTIQILEEQVKKSETPNYVLVEEERRKKAMEEHMARLKLPTKKFAAKRINAKETTMEEILEMRGFRGPPRNCKNTIWIKKPDFIGYLKPMARKPKAVYEPPKMFKPAKKGKISEGVASTYKSETFSDIAGFYHIIPLGRRPVAVEDELAPLPAPPVPKKRLKPHYKEEKGFNKYFGSLDKYEESQFTIQK